MKHLERVVLLGAVFLAGCSVNPAPDGNGTGDPNASVLTKGLNLPPGTNAVLAVKSTAGPSSTGAKASSVAAQVAGEVVLDSAVVVFKEIELHQEAVDDGTESDENETELEGPFVVDLVAETVTNLGTGRLDDDADDDGVDDSDDDDDDGDGTPDDEDDDDDGDGIPDDDDQTSGETRLFDALELPPGTYHRIEFELDRLDAEDADSPDDPMVGFSILAAGSINGVPMEYCADFEEEFEFQSANGIVVDPDLVATFLLTVDPIGWFADVDPALGTLSEDGVLRMCGEENVELAGVVRDAIRQRARLGRDEDGDGEDDDDDEDGDLEDGEDDDDADPVDGGTDDATGGDGDSGSDDPGTVG